MEQDPTRSHCCIEAPSIDTFMNRLDNHFKDRPGMDNCRTLDSPVKPQITNLEQLPIGKQFPL